jgi:hypothetical protein
MFETMHYDIHLEKERGMFKAAETSRQIRLLRTRRRKLRPSKPLFDNLRHAVSGKTQQLRHAIDSILFPGHHSLNAGK